MKKTTWKRIHIEITTQLLQYSYFDVLYFHAIWLKFECIKQWHRSQVKDFSKQYVKKKFAPFRTNSKEYRYVNFPLVFVRILSHSIWRFSVGVVCHCASDWVCHKLSPYFAVYCCYCDPFEYHASMWSFVPFWRTVFFERIFFSIEYLFSNHLRIKFKTYHGKFPLEIDSVNENEASKLCAWKGLWKLISKCNKFSHFWLLQRIKRLLKWAFFSET